MNIAFARHAERPPDDASASPFPPRSFAAPFAAVASSVLYALCFPAADFGFLAWLALVPFLLTFPHARMRTAIGCGLLFGLFQALGVVYWMGVFAGSKLGAEMGVVACVLAALIHTPFTALFAVLANLVWRASPVARLIAVPAAWAFCEWLAELGTFGMGWGDFGYTQWHNIPILQFASIAGVFGIGYLIVLCNVAIASRDRRLLAIAAVIVGSVALWGAFEARIDPGTPRLRVAAIQENIDQDVYWVDNRRPADPAYFYGTLAAFDQLVAQAASRGARLAALPETAIPGFIQFDRELRLRVENWASANHLDLVAGGRYIEPAHGQNQNVVFLIAPFRGATGVYAKTRLVPFGEYLPYRRLFSFLQDLQVSIVDEAPGSPGQHPLPTDIWVSGRRVVAGPMICFESSYTQYARRQVLRGATVLSVVTDDEWYGRTSAARQHMAMSALRAAETHRSLVRAAVSGISAIFDSRGRRICELAWYKRGVLVADVPIESGITPYVRFGNWFVVLCCIVFLATLFTTARRIGGCPAGEHE
ncbi:MAG: apolipoprotein N-acyltransferase [Capsulimonadaceae bacterium]|nr:apolipoprotein N-acyltransferase [Capsulimonadaceae bacterium]